MLGWSRAGFGPAEKGAACDKKGAACDKKGAESALFAAVVSQLEQLLSGTVGCSFRNRLQPGYFFADPRAELRPVPRPRPIFLANSERCAAYFGATIG